MKNLVVAIAILVLGGGLWPLAALAANPCCGITAINAQTGLVTAVDKATGRTFQFKVSGPATLKGLRAGQAVHADFATGRISLNGIGPCCPITTARAGSAVQPTWGTPCCQITGINAQTGLVTAVDRASGRTFQFHTADAALLRGLRQGQAVYADFAAGRVSVDGIGPCCQVR